MRRDFRRVAVQGQVQQGDRAIRRHVHAQLDLLEVLAPTLGVAVGAPTRTATPSWPTSTTSWTPTPRRWGAHSSWSTMPARGTSPARRSRTSGPAPAGRAGRQIRIWCCAPTKKQTASWWMRRCGPGRLSNPGAYAGRFRCGRPTTRWTPPTCGLNDPNAEASPRANQARRAPGTGMERPTIHERIGWPEKAGYRHPAHEESKRPLFRPQAEYWPDADCRDAIVEEMTT